MNWILPAAGDTEALGAAFGTALRESATAKFLLLLAGDLGAGKTTFVRGLLRSLGHAGPVPSPTYTLVETYEMGALVLHHLDLYRLADAEELEFLGWRELSDGICLVEWPGRAANILGNGDFQLHFRLSGDGRQVSGLAGTDSGRKVGAKVAESTDLTD